jgi:predicted HTH domain antitoxin
MCQTENSMSQVLEIEVPDDVPLELKKDNRGLANEMRLAAAVKWYELGLITQGKAAEIAALSRAEFLNELSRYKVSPFQETASDILSAVTDARK